MSTKGKGKLGYPVGKVALLPSKPEENNSSQSDGEGCIFSRRTDPQPLVLQSKYSSVQGENQSDLLELL